MQTESVRCTIVGVGLHKGHVGRCLGDTLLDDAVVISPNSVEKKLGSRLRGKGLHGAGGGGLRLKDAVLKGGDAAGGLDDDDVPRPLVQRLTEGDPQRVGLARKMRYGGRAFGDGGNDLALVRAVAVGVAMGNACDELKAEADYVTSSVDEDGVQRALEYFELI